MAKGNSKAYLNSPIADNTEVNVQENALMIRMCLDVFNSPEPELDKPEEVEKAINNYFNSCISKGLRPGNMGLYASVGLTRSQVRDLIQGKIKHVDGVRVSSKSIAHIKKAQKTLSLFRESLGSEGRLNPATLIFWQKNFDGLEDVQRVELDANAAPKADRTPEEIAKMIESDIPIDADFAEIRPAQNQGGTDQDKRKSFAPETVKDAQ